MENFSIFTNMGQTFMFSIHNASKADSLIGSGSNIENFLILLFQFKDLLVGQKHRFTRINWIIKNLSPDLFIYWQMLNKINLIIILILSNAGTLCTFFYGKIVIWASNLISKLENYIFWMFRIKKMGNYRVIFLGISTGKTFLYLFNIIY